MDAGLESVAIITPYVEQARQVRRLLAELSGTGDIECSTVHRFQGHERDLILFDLVDAEPLPAGVLFNGDRPFSAAANLLNVSVSRARAKLVLVADVEYFRLRAPGGLASRLLERAGGGGIIVGVDRLKT